MENLIVYSNEMLGVEITEYLLIHFQSHGEIKTLGLFLTMNAPEDKERICELVQSHCEMAQEESEGKAENPSEVQGSGQPAGAEDGENRPMGRRISLSELFGMR